MIPAARSLSALFLLPLLLLVGRAGDETPPAYRVLVQTNESALVGVIEQEATCYRVKNEKGEIVVPAKQVLRICESREEAFELLKSRANLRDPQEHVRLARWCWNLNLLEQARAEADAALKLAPKYAEAQRLAKTLAEARPAEMPARKPKQADSGFAAGDAKDVALPVQTKPLKEHNYTADTLQSFTRKIQPILFNGCGTGMCHGGSKANGYELQRPFGSGGVPASMTRQNLLQTLSLLDKEDPANSPLLRKALERHGGGNRPPLAGKDALAYQSLEAWVLATCGAKPAEAPPMLDEPPKKDAEGDADKTGSFAGVRPPAGTPQMPSSPLPQMPTVPLRPRIVAGADGQPTIESPTSMVRPMGPLRTPGDLGTITSFRRPAGTPVFEGGDQVGSSAPESKSPAGKNAEAAKKPAKEQPKPVDPFDPAQFNRQHHPDR